jgi:hypothetical protein
MDCVMVKYQIQGTGGVRDRRPRRVRDRATGRWLAAPVSEFTPPVWTKDRAAAALFLPVAGWREIDLLRAVHGIEADLD